jgi:hypothetical protein
VGSSQSKSRCGKRLARFLGGSYGHSADFDFWSPARRTCKKGRGIAPSRSDREERCFLIALLEVPTTHQTHRSPLKWLSAMGFHIVIVAALIIVPLYTTGTIHLNEYNEIPLIAPPPPPAPPPRTVHATPHIAQ